MDRVLNPFAPGAGTPPPELAGRDEVRETIRIMIERVRRGLPAKSILMVGLRGVGKTVLLDRMRDDAEAEAVQTMRIEAPEAALCRPYWPHSSESLSCDYLKMSGRKISHTAR